MKEETGWTGFLIKLSDFKKKKQLSDSNPNQVDF